MKWLARTALALVLVVAALLAGVHLLLRASLPRLDGTLEVSRQDESSRLTSPVTIERDAIGIPTIRGATRDDVAFGTGFVHAQERFFQMDLSRRLAAGELAGLFGAAAEGQDARARAFGFRELAREVLRRSSDEERAGISAYTRGVNAGLRALRSRPWEYWLLGSEPAPWRDEDALLVAYSMWWDLQYGDWQREIVLRTFDARIGGPVCASGWKCATEFFYPARSEWDAPNVADSPTPTRLAMLAAVPPPQALDVRQKPSALSLQPSAGSQPSALSLQPSAWKRKSRDLTRSPLAPGRQATPGSNNWALAGRLTASGAALVANDMHLTTRVPIVWYRARLVVGPPGKPVTLDLNGVTLPGAPTLVAGSNGHIAWGFTNSYGDYQDVTLRPCEASGRGVRVAQAGDGRCWFTSWVAQLPGASNLGMSRLERAASVEEALALAPTIGIPHNNLVVGDREGRIGWTVIGRIPRGRSAERTSDAAGWLDANEQPRIFDPPSGRLWTANALPTLDPEQERAIGDDEAAVGVGYDLGARASQIRDGLFALDGGATPADMLRIQLDERAMFLASWHPFVLGLLDEAAMAQESERAEFRRLVADWTSRATTDAVGYRLLRHYQDRVERAVWTMLLVALEIPTEEARVPSRFEAPLWRLVTEQPLHLLAADYPDWRAFLLSQLDETLTELRAECGELAACTWGGARAVHIRHPLSSALPFLSRFLDMPRLELPGDTEVPRVQTDSFGASERFAVSPGHEAQGYLHIAGGQSGHPLSPFYRAGFREWAEGKPLPFLPGETRHQLLLQ